MAKQVLITCDSCGGVVPIESIRKWWGLVNTGGDIPDMRFGPLRTDNLDKLDKHACSEGCLAKLLMAFAQSVDMKKAATAKRPDSLFGGFMRMPMFGLGESDTKDSIGYYKNDKDDDEEEDEL